MLTTILKSSPKFVVFQDDVKQNASEILKYLITNIVKFESHKPLLYYEFEFNRRINLYGCLNGARKVTFIGGFDGTDDEKDAERLLQIQENNCIIVVDSLAHFVHRFGKNRAYKMLCQLKRDRNVSQIITVLHKHLFDDEDIVYNYVGNLAMLNVDLLPKFLSSNNRASYIYKKPGGKITSDIEEYYMDNGVLVTKVPEKIDALNLLQQDSFNPDELTTFKISLDDKDMEARSNLVLPYLPKDGLGNEAQSGGEIFYQFDEVDDWDEEDPDDDLDL